MVVATNNDEPVLPKFYAGRDIFITGATGFMGKVLIERLLSTCPDLEQLYLLMRGKGEMSPHKRLYQLKQSQVFDCIRTRAPHQLDKLQCIPGDVSLPLLGLTENDILILRKVSVVFHSAATIKFWEPLVEAVPHNVNSVLQLMDLCDRLPALEALVHVSTAFTNAEKQYIEERVYELPNEVTVPRVLALIDALPENLLQQITPQYISPKINTYLFTKSLAEVAVNERTTRDYAVAIFRPSIVVSTHRAPFPGWIEGLSGASGVVAGMAQGTMKAINIDVDAHSDAVPVDIAIDNMIAVAWEIATDKFKTLKVYYCGSQENSQTWKQFRTNVLRAVAEYPFDNTFYYPYIIAVKNTFMYNVLEFFFQVIPLYTAEYLLKILGIKTKGSLIIASQRLSAMTKVLAFFTCKEWTFSVQNLRALRERLRRTDGHIYHLDINVVDWEQHTRDYVRGMRRHVFRFKDDSLPHAKKRHNRLRMIHYGVLLMLALLSCRLLIYLLRVIT